MTKLLKIFPCLTVALIAAGPLVALPAPVQAAPVAISAPLELPGAPAADPSAWLYLLPALGAIRIKDTGALAKKFVQRAGAAGSEYTDGVKSAGQDWESGAKAGEENYKIAVTQAANEGRFGKGVSNAGAAKFVARASVLGAQRYPTGVAASEQDWARGTQPYLDALKSMELPAKRPRGQNAERANAVAQRLHQMRVGK